MSLLLRLHVAESVPMSVCVLSLCVYEYKSVQEYVWVSVRECVMGGRICEVNLCEWESDFEC